MNILFLGGGRRVTLAELFIDRGHKIFAYERSYNVPIASVAEVIMGLKWKDILLVSDLNTIVKDYKIDLIIPLQDEAVQLLAYNKEQLNCKCLVSTKLASMYSFNKFKFSEFIKKEFPELYIETHLLPIEKPFDELQNFLNTVDYPIIVKPVFGFNSRDITTVENIIQFNHVIKKAIESGDIYIYQSLIKGKEYSVDGYVTMSGDFIDAIPRERIRVDGGEVVTSKTKDFPQLVLYSKNIATALGIRGPFNIQFIVNDTNIKVVEVNARFGGGCTLSIASGVDMPYFIECECSNEPFYYISGSWIKNMLME
jgi:carbamoyl-phosphate synthase large subunit